MIIGNGIDVVEVERIKKVYEKYGEAFLRKIFTGREQRLIRNKNFVNYNSMAARFAAKEAVFKALDLKGRGAGWADAEVLRSEQGRPLLLLYRVAAKVVREKRGKKVYLSLSHTKDYAVAHVFFTK